MTTISEITWKFRELWENKHYLETKSHFNHFDIGHLAFKALLNIQKIIKVKDI